METETEMLMVADEDKEPNNEGFELAYVFDDKDDDKIETYEIDELDEIEGDLD